MHEDYECELCGSDNTVELFSIHREIDEDCTLHAEALVCASCWCKFESNDSMFLAILNRRVEMAEEEEDV